MFLSKRGGIWPSQTSRSTLTSINYARQTMGNVNTLTQSATPIVLTNSELDLHLTKSTELFQQYLVTTVEHG